MQVAEKSLGKKDYYDVKYSSTLFIHHSQQLTNKNYSSNRKLEALMFKDLLESCFSFKFYTKQMQLI